MSRRLTRRERHRIVNASRRRGGRSWRGRSSEQHQCTGKRKFPDEEEALAAIAEIRSRIVMINGVGPKGKLGAYRCLRCDSWHLGHSRYRDE